MDTTEWLKRYAPGFQMLSSKERKEIMHFLFLWSLFESEALNKRGNVTAITTVVRDWVNAGLLTGDSFELQLAYFQNRYYRDDDFTDHFDHLKLQNSDRPDLVRKVLRNDATDRSEIVAAVLIIVYRFRNNLFHGEKWAYQLKGQLENFNHANVALMQAMDLQSQAPK